jgi:DnaD/phage-associated family protein
MAFGANVEDKESFRRFLDNLDTTAYKTISILRQLGKRNNPTEAQKELYLKWSALWKFSHEMILKAVEETVSADNPNMKYVDAILKDWQEKGIKTPEELQLYRQKQQAENKVSLNEAANKVKNSRGKMNNFQHTGQDYRQLEE